MRTTEAFLENVWAINKSYKERFCYNLCQYTGSFNKITLTCKKHNCLFDIIAQTLVTMAKNEIKHNILLSAGCKQCLSDIRKTNPYKNNDKNLPENYNDVDWKVIPDFDSYYINNKGDIWSTLTNQFIQLHLNNSGYLVANLCKQRNVKSDKKSFRRIIHILVAQTFVHNPNPELYDIVNHMDGNKANPLYSNLEWTNTMQNMKHAHAMGLTNHDNQRNEITILDLDDNVIQIFYSQKDLCKNFEVSDFLVTNYFKNKESTDYLVLNYLKQKGSPNNKLNTILTEKRWKLERKYHKPIVDLKIYTDEDECWKEILPDYPNYYISNFGNAKKMGKISKMANEEGFISPILNGGIFSINLKNGKNFQTKRVHRLVLQYHLVCKYDTSNMIIDHIDSNKENNYIGNLEWVDNHIITQRAMINGCWNKPDRKQIVSHIDIDRSKYRIKMMICGKLFCRYTDTFGEAIQKKKELYAIMIISNYIKFKKGLYPKYYMLNINFESITDEINLHIEELG